MNVGLTSELIPTAGASKTTLSTRAGALIAAFRTIHPPFECPDEQSLLYSQGIEELRRPACVVGVRARTRGGLAFPGIVHRVDQVQSEVLSQLCDVESPHEGVVARPVKQQQGPGTLLAAEQQVGLPARRLHEALFAGDGPAAEDPVIVFEQLVPRSLGSVYRNVPGFSHTAFYPIQYSRPSRVRFIKPRSNISRLNNA